MLKRISNKKILRLQEDFFGEGSCSPEIDDSDLSLKIAQAQLKSCEAQIPAIEWAVIASVFSELRDGFDPTDLRVKLEYEYRDKGVDTKGGK